MLWEVRFRFRLPTFSQFLSQHVLGFRTTPTIGCTAVTLNLSLALSRFVCDLVVVCDTTVCVSGLSNSYAACSDELWRLSLATLEWTKIGVASGGVRPSARARHTMTSVGLDLWVHGGYTNSGEGDSCTTRAALLRQHGSCAEAESEPLSSLQHKELLCHAGVVSC